jgi:hypothetical protein
MDVNILSLPPAPPGTQIIVTLLQAAGLILAAVLGATLLKWNESWHNAQQTARAINGICLNYLRHSAANMDRIASHLEKMLNEKDQNFPPSKEMIQKQKYEVSDLTERTKERITLFGPKMIAKMEHLFLRIRNINIELDAGLRKDENGIFKHRGPTEDFYANIFDRNQAIAIMAHEICLITQSILDLNRAISWLKRFYYISKHKETIFTQDVSSYGHDRNLSDMEIYRTILQEIRNADEIDRLSEIKAFVDLKMKNSSTNRYI